MIIGKQSRDVGAIIATTFEIFNNDIHMSRIFLQFELLTFVNVSRISKIICDPASCWHWLPLTAIKSIYREVHTASSTIITLLVWFTRAQTGEINGGEAA